MFYFKDQSIILNKKNIKEKSAVIYILTKKYGLKKAIAEGINRPQSRLLTVIQPGAVGKIFIVGEDNVFKLLSFLPQRIPFKVFKFFPYMYLWALRFLTILNFLEISEDFWVIVSKLDKYVLKFKKFFPEWFLFVSFKELGIEPNLFTCSKCFRKLTYEKDIFLYKSYLFCQNCKKESYEKIKKMDYLHILNFIMNEEIYIKDVSWKNILRKILKSHLKEIHL